MTIKGRRFYQTGVMTLADCGELCAYNKHPEQAVKRCTEILSIALQVIRRVCESSTFK